MPEKVPPLCKLPLMRAFVCFCVFASCHVCLHIEENLGKLMTWQKKQRKIGATVTPSYAAVVNNQEKLVLSRCKPGLKTCCCVLELVSLMRCVCFVTSTHSFVSFTEQALIDHRDVLRHQLKAPFSFLAQANGFTLICNVCTILDLACCLFTFAPYGHSVRGTLRRSRNLPCENTLSRLTFHTPSTGIYLHPLYWQW